MTRVEKQQAKAEAINTVLKLGRLIRPDMKKEDLLPLFEHYKVKHITECTCPVRLIRTISDKFEFPPATFYVYHGVLYYSC